MHNKGSNPVFRALDETGQGVVAIRDILARLEDAGFADNDPRLTSLTEQLRRHGADSQDAIDSAKFDELMTAGQSLLERTVKEELVIPQFSKFAGKIEELFEVTRDNRSGDVASYIPQLARVAPDQFGVAVCTIDGQRLVLGDAGVPFSFQSSCKPILYCAALETLGEELVHSHVGREPSGQSFNELTLYQTAMSKTHRSL